MVSSAAQSQHNHAVYQLGDWQVMAAGGVLLRDGHRVHVEPKLMDVLLCLIAAQGMLVTRETLLTEAWPRVVVNEEVLTRAISELRTLLGDVSRERRYIRTVPKRGYMLVMPAQRCDLPTPVAGFRDNAATVAPQPNPGWPALLYARLRTLPGTYAPALLVVATLSSISLWFLSEVPPVEFARSNPSHLEAGQTANATAAPALQLRRELASMHKVLGSHNEFNDTGATSTPIFLTPLSALTDDAQTRAFAAGLMADLQHELALQPSFQVVYSVDSEAPALMLSGNVRIYQQQARINLQLIATDRASLVWSGSFEVKLQSPLQVQTTIARHVSQELDRIV